MFTVAKVISVLLGIIGTSYILPISVAIFYKEYSVLASFIVPMIFSWLLAFVFLFFKKKKFETLSIRYSFLVVVLAWISSCIFGSIPLYFSGSIPNYLDALFESVSGFTTTGASICSDVESLPRSINLWRCQTHWLGGMGIVALTVALLPVLGIGGFFLIKAETTGPDKSKFTPKITTTAKYLWFIYLVLTILQTIFLKISGMDFIDALSHSFSTLGTGGFSTKNTSISYFNSSSIEIICTVFMFFASVNFTMYYYILSGKFSLVKNNTELRSYLLIILVSVSLIVLVQNDNSSTFLTTVKDAFFQVLSILSTTGFYTKDYTTWLYGAQIVILLLFFIGGCSGSTAGGVKVVRWSILYKQFTNEIKKMVHPREVFSIRLNKNHARKEIVYTVASFIFIYFFLVIVSTFIASLSGMDVLTSFTSSLSMIGNVGPAFNTLGPTCSMASVSPFVKMWFILLMIIGRLEIFSIIIFFTPNYYKR